MPGGFELLAPWVTAEVGVCVGVACAAHLRHVQRRAADAY